MASACVEVTYLSLDVAAASLARFLSFLARDELQAASRFRFERHRRRYVAGRGALRCILAAHLKSDPAALRFGYSDTGKPFLIEAPANLSFNLAHSDSEAAIAVAHDAQVGVDIELVRTVPDFREIASDVFSDVELGELAAATDPQLAFLRGWTRKEAFVKGTGAGLGSDLRRISVGLRCEQTRPVTGRDVSDWTVQSLHHPHCVAALAVRSANLSPTCRVVGDWSSEDGQNTATTEEFRGCVG